MADTPRRLFDDPDQAATLPGLYDRDPVAEAEAWFLPAPEPPHEGLPPLRRADRRRLFDPIEWRAAQDRLSGELAELAARFGALDERLRTGPEGARHRLAMLEVEALSWWAGDRIGLDRLALWAGLRIAGAQDDAQALARAGWALRRLTAGPPPEAGGWTAGLAGFLGRGDAGGAPEAVAGLAEVMQDMAALHPAVQAAVLFRAWRVLGQGQASTLEAAVMAARHGPGRSRGYWPSRSR